MKRIVLRDRGQFKARDVITAILEMPSSASGITYAEMRKRDRVLTTLERAKGDSFFDLEDADYAVLRSLLDTFQFAVSKRDLIHILDDVANAKSPEETPSLKLVEGNEGA